MDRTHVVYRCFDADGALLYVGQTGNLQRRITKHKSHHPDWWPLVVDIHPLRPTTLGAARRYERMAIRSERPVHNTMTMLAAHGTVTRYGYHGCRCELCRRVNADRQRSRSERQSAALRADPSLAPHGSAATYGNWKCRCLDCRAAAYADELERKKRTAS